MRGWFLEQESKEELRQINDFLTDNMAQFKWQVKQRQRMTVFDEKFWSLDGLLELHPIHSCIYLIEQIESLPEQLASQDAVDKLRELMSDVLEVKAFMEQFPISNLTQDQKVRRYLSLTLRHGMASVNSIFSKFVRS